MIGGVLFRKWVWRAGCCDRRRRRRRMMTPTRPPLGARGGRCWSSPRRSPAGVVPPQREGVRSVGRSIGPFFVLSRKFPWASRRRCRSGRRKRRFRSGGACAKPGHAASAAPDRRRERTKRWESKAVPKRSERRTDAATKTKEGAEEKEIGSRSLNASNNRHAGFAIYLLGIIVVATLLNKEGGGGINRKSFGKKEEICIDYYSTVRSNPIKITVTSARTYP